MFTTTNQIDWRSGKYGVQKYFLCYSSCMGPLRLHGHKRHFSCWEQSTVLPTLYGNAAVVELINVDLTSHWLLRIPTESTTRTKLNSFHIDQVLAFVVEIFHCYSIEICVEPYCILVYTNFSHMNTSNDGTFVITICSQIRQLVMKTNNIWHKMFKNCGCNVSHFCSIDYCNCQKTKAYFQEVLLLKKEIKKKLYRKAFILLNNWVTRH